MRVTRTELPGVLLIEPVVHRDMRGFFVETFHQQRFAESGLDLTFVQDNHSCSSYGTIRGLHLQRRNPQGKLVRVIEGEVWDVAVDLRVGEPTFGNWIARTLSADNFRQMFIPAGFAHGLCVLSPRAQVLYKCTTPYDPDDELGIAYDDPGLAIQWPVDQPLLSDRDRRHPGLSTVARLLASDT